VIRYIRGLPQCREEFAAITSDVESVEFDHLEVCSALILLPNPLPSRFEVRPDDSSEATALCVLPVQASVLPHSAESAHLRIAPPNRRLDQFDPPTKQPFLQLIQDNMTRWTSFHDTLQRACNLRPRIDRFCKLHRPHNGDRGLQDDLLVTITGHQIERTQDVLTYFHKALLFGECHRAFLSMSFRQLQWLMNELAVLKDQF